MSQEPQRGMRRTQPPPSQPHMGQGTIHDQYQYIPGPERSYGHAQRNIHPQHTHTYSPGNNSASFPPIAHHNPPPPYFHGNPQPPPPACPPPLVFSCPPPPPPPAPAPRFPQPPPPVPHTSNIPYHPAFGSAMVPHGDCSTWHQHNAPPVPVPAQLQGNRVPVPATLSSCGDSSYRVTVQQKEEDSKWLEEFEKRIKSYPPSPSSLSDSTTTTSKKNVKLAEVQRLMLESCTLKEQLGGVREKLTQVENSAEKDEWDGLLQQAEEIKARLKEIMETFRDQEFIERTRTLVKQRRAKRNRVRRRKKEVQLEKEELKRKREEEEAKIDAWRAKLQREEDTKRRKEAVKREADSVLGEVRQKQNEGQRMLQLLEALGDLRCTRVTQAASEGQAKDVEAGQRFTNTTEMLRKIVKEQLKEYELEEQTLRVMMEESASHRSVALSGKSDASCARYEEAIKKLLFGPTVISDSEEDNGLTLETVVQRRQEWDQYVVEGEHPLASSVPLSWVLPPGHPQASWAAFLNT